MSLLRLMVTSDSVDPRKSLDDGVRCDWPLAIVDSGMIRADFRVRSGRLARVSSIRVQPFPGNVPRPIDFGL